MLAAFGGALLVCLLPACSTEAGPTPAKQAPDPGPEALSVRLDALMTDPCFLRPTELASAGCEKYVTQVASVPGTARKYVKAPEATEAGQRLEKGVDGYWDGGCAGETTPACTDSLVTIATELTAVHRSLATLPEGG